MPQPTNCDQPFACGLVLFGGGLDPDRAIAELPFKKAWHRRYPELPDLPPRYEATLSRGGTAEQLSDEILGVVEELRPARAFLEEHRAAGGRIWLVVVHFFCHGYLLVGFKPEALGALADLGIELRVESLANGNRGALTST